MLDRPAAVAESLLFPFDGGVRPMKPAFASSNSGDTGEFRCVSIIRLGRHCCAWFQHRICQTLAAPRRTLLSALGAAE